MSKLHVDSSKMSTGIVHQPDTPGSSGSPSSQVETETEILKMDDSAENVEIKSSSSPVNGDFRVSDSCSSSSSPSVTPNLSFTPPVNGILTPPTDMDANDSIKQDNAGRLKFYKDGVLCLELSHRDEGEKRKWVQIRTKQVFPVMIHTKKEVKIPRHASPTPPSFNSPLSSNQFHYRLESSHSTSDDGSSMLSSPRVRESSWRKPVPQKGISLSLEFYLKPAVCIHKFREISRLENSRLYTRPYNPCIIPASQNSDLACSCDINCKTETIDKSVVNAVSDTVDGKCDQERLTNGTKLLSKQTRPNKIRQSILTIAEILLEREKKLQLTHKTKVQDYSSISHRRHDQTVLTKKRAYKETDMQDFSSPVRPSKISPRNKSVKTILNIPGFNSEVGTLKVSLENNNEGQPSCGISHNKSDMKGKSGKNGMAKNKSAEVSYPFVATLISPNSSAKTSRKSPDSPKSHSQSPSRNDSQNANNNELYLSSLPPKEQQIFQQQTMSKAISYTINSLLNQETSKNIAAKNMDKDKHKIAKSNKSQTNHTTGGNSPHKQFFPPKNDQDQNSFLRHLLDTSDPIPIVEKSEKVPSKLSQDSVNMQPNKSKSIKKEILTETKAKPRVTPTGKNKHLKPPADKTPPALSNFSHSSPPSNPNPMGMFPHAAFLQHPALFGGGFQLPLQAYSDSMFGGHQQSSMGALELQYQSLLQQNLLALNPTLAAAMAASYLGSSPVHPTVSTTPPSSSSSSSSAKSPRRSDNSNNGNNSSRPLNLSQRDMPNGLNMRTTSIPVPFQAPSSGTSHSRGSKRGGSSKSHDNFNNDMPLNLSKKT